MRLTKKQRIPGLYLFCNDCKSWYRYDTDVKCKCKRLVYKYKVHVPMTDNQTRIKVLEATNIDDALLECKKFKDALEGTQFQKVDLDEEKTTPVLLVDCIESFMEHIRDEQVAEHEKANRTKPVIKRYERALLVLCLALEENGLNSKTLWFTHLNRKMVGYYHKYLLETKKLENKTYNHYRACVMKFSKYIIKENKLQCEDALATLKKRPTEKDPRGIRIGAFIKVMDYTRPENSFYYDGKENTVRRSYYRNWLKTAFVLGLFTGGRREEVVNMKWNGLKYSESGEITHIEVIHYKKMRAKRNLLGKNKKIIKRVPMNEDLLEFLIELGYEQKKGLDEFILAPNEKASREHMMNVITNAFCHYYKTLFPDDPLEFRHLRKTYITTLYGKRGDQVHLDTDHEGMDVLHTSYIDQDMLMEMKRAEFKKIGKIFSDKK